MDDTPVPPLPATPPSYAPIRGVTRTTEDAQGSQGVAIRGSVAGQAGSWLLFVAALLPPLVLLLVDGLTGAARLIPYSPLWALGAVILGLVLVLRAGVAASSSQRANAFAALGGPVVLLLAAIVILVLRLRLHAIPLPLAIAQVVCYLLCAFALLLAPTSLSPAA